MVPPQVHNAGYYVGIKGGGIGIKCAERNTLKEDRENREITRINKPLPLSDEMACKLDCL